MGESRINFLLGPEQSSNLLFSDDKAVCAHFGKYTRDEIKITHTSLPGHCALLSVAQMLNKSAGRLWQITGHLFKHSFKGEIKICIFPSRCFPKVF